MPEHNVEFYIPQSEIIPTTLRLMVDGKQVTYKRLPNNLGYDFRFNNGETEEEAIEMAKYLAQIMCDQSYDHGQEWRITSVELVDQKGRYAIPFKIGEVVRVLFRVRDSY